MKDIGEQVSDDDATSKLLHRARLTMVEYSMLEGIVLSKASPDKAKIDINCLIGSLDRKDDKSRPSIPVTDLHAGLWGFTSEVLSGATLF